MVAAFTMPFAIVLSELSLDFLYTAPLSTPTSSTMKMAGGTAFFPEPMSSSGSNSVSPMSKLPSPLHGFHEHALEFTEHITV